jgi:hypothetical protein
LILPAAWGPIRKIDEALSLNADFHRNANWRISDTVIIEKIFGGIGTVGNASNGSSRHPFAVVQNFVNITLNCAQPYR